LPEQGLAGGSEAALDAADLLAVEGAEEVDAGGVGGGDEEDEEGAGEGDEELAAYVSDEGFADRGALDEPGVGRLAGGARWGEGVSSCSAWRGVAPGAMVTASQASVPSG
jgi:hypothetical protein